MNQPNHKVAHISALSASDLETKINEFISEDMRWQLKTVYMMSDVHVAWLYWSRN